MDLVCYIDALYKLLNPAEHGLFATPELRHLALPASIGHVVAQSQHEARKITVESGPSNYTQSGTENLRDLVCEIRGLLANGLRQLSPAWNCPDPPPVEWAPHQASTVKFAASAASCVSSADASQVGRRVGRHAPHRHRVPAPSQSSAEAAQSSTRGG